MKSILIMLCIFLFLYTQTSTKYNQHKLLSSFSLFQQMISDSLIIKQTGYDTEETKDIQCAGETCTHLQRLYAGLTQLETAKLDAFHRRQLKTVWRRRWIRNNCTYTR